MLHRLFLSLRMCATLADPKQRRHSQLVTARVCARVAENTGCACAKCLDQSTVMHTNVMHHLLSVLSLPPIFARLCQCQPLQAFKRTHQHQLGSWRTRRGVRSSAAGAAGAAGAANTPDAAELPAEEQAQQRSQQVRQAHQGQRVPQAQLAQQRGRRSRRSSHRGEASTWGAAAS